MAKMSRREVNASKYKKFVGNKSEGIDNLLRVFTVEFVCTL